jgi:hypothetical protein
VNTGDWANTRIGRLVLRLPQSVEAVAAKLRAAGVRGAAAYVGS